MHRFNPDHHEKLDDKERFKWQDPRLLLDWLDLEGNETVVDIGAGTGFVARPLAERWPGVTMITVDISPKMKEIVEQRAGAAGLKNIRPLLTDGRTIELADGVANVILLVNVLHELADDPILLAEARRILKRAGQLVLVDWKQDLTPVGPPVEERIGGAAAMELVATYDFVPSAELDLYPYHYMMVFV